VFAGRIRPGQRLVTQKLSERFEVSHTPIREALINLAGMGIVEHVPNRGAIVRRLRAKDVKEICHVRRALECEAVRRACGRVEDSALNDVAARLGQFTNGHAEKSPGRVEAARQLDDELHDLIAQSCGNTFLANELGRLKLLFRAFRDVAWEQRVAARDFARLAEEAEEHLQIVQALRNNDRAAASQSMSRHVISGGRYWSRALTQTKL